MRRWLARLLGPPDRSANGASPPNEDAWREELLELARKSARAQVRLTAKLDDLDAKLQGGFTDLRSSAQRSSQSGRVAAEWDGTSAALPQRGQFLDEVLDALDTLDHAAASADVAAAPTLAEGLRSVASKLEAALLRVSIERVRTAGLPVSGKLFRVVGTDDRPDLPAGAVSRVVRAAAVSGGRVLREGEVFVNKGSGP
jgi:molecular chaperone GrpE (heat shock protein)